MEEDDDIIESPQLRVIEHVKLYNTGDLKWMAILLGMDGMSSEWYIFCFLYRKQWQVTDYEKGSPRKIEKILEQATNTTTTQVIIHHARASPPALS